MNRLNRLTCGWVKINKRLILTRPWLQRCRNGDHWILRAPGHCQLSPWSKGAFRKHWQGANGFPQLCIFYWMGAELGGLCWADRPRRVDKIWWQRLRPNLPLRLPFHPLSTPLPQKCLLSAGGEGALAGHPYSAEGLHGRCLLVRCHEWALWHICGTL